MNSEDYNICKIDIYDGRVAGSWFAYCTLNTMETTYDVIISYVGSCNELKLSINSNNFGMDAFNELNNLIKKNTNLLCIDLYDFIDSKQFNLNIPINCTTITLPYCCVDYLTNPPLYNIFIVPEHVEEIVLADCSSKYVLKNPNNIKWISLYFKSYGFYYTNNKIYDFRDLIFLQEITVNNTNWHEHLEFKMPYGCCVVVDDNVYDDDDDDYNDCVYDYDDDFIYVKENYLQ